MHFLTANKLASAIPAAEADGLWRGRNTCWAVVEAEETEAAIFH